MLPSRIRCLIESSTSFSKGWSRHSIMSKSADSSGPSFKRSNSAFIASGPLLLTSKVIGRVSICLIGLSYVGGLGGGGSGTGLISLKSCSVGNIPFLLLLARRCGSQSSIGSRSMISTRLAAVFIAKTLPLQYLQYWSGYFTHEFVCVDR